MAVVITSNYRIVDTWGGDEKDVEMETDLFVER